MHRTRSLSRLILGLISVVSVYGCSTRTMLGTDATHATMDAATPSDAGVDMFVAPDQAFAEDMFTPPDMAVVDMAVVDMAAADMAMPTTPLVVPACAFGTGHDLRAYRIHEERPARTTPTVSDAVPGVADIQYQNLNLAVLPGNRVVVAATVVTEELYLDPDAGVDAATDDSGTIADPRPQSPVLAAPILASFDGTTVRTLDDPDTEHYWTYARPIVEPDLAESAGQLFGFAAAPSGATARLLGDFQAVAPFTWDGSPRTLWYTPDINTAAGQVDVSAVTALAVGVPAVWSTPTYVNNPQNVPSTFVFDGDGHLHFIGTSIASNLMTVVDVVAAIEPSVTGSLPWTARVVDTIAFPGSLHNYVTGEPSATMPDGTARIISGSHFFEYSTSARAWTDEAIPAVGPFAMGVTSYVDYVNAGAAQPFLEFELQPVFHAGSAILQREASGDWIVTSLPHPSWATPLGDMPYAAAEGSSPAIAFTGWNALYPSGTDSWDVFGQVDLVASDAFPLGQAEMQSESTKVARAADGTLYVLTALDYIVDDSGWTLRVDEQLVLYICPPGGDCWCH